MTTVLDAKGIAERDAKIRVSWLGLLVNLPLGAGKIVLGVLGQSQALVADGVHSLSDLLSDIAVLFAVRQGAVGPDVDHPYGHGRFETVGTVFVAALLLLVGLGIAGDAVRGLFMPERLGAPGPLALAAALLSLLVKELLYRRTMAVARDTRSRLIAANAWHHRSDALSSGVALVGIAGAIAGLAVLDAVAAIIIAVMLTHVAFQHAWPALKELVDTGLDRDERALISTEIMRVPGVRGMRQLRTRHSGAAALADVAVFVDPLISVSEAHHISEAVSARLVANVDLLTQVVVHVEPAGHADADAALALPLRPEVETALHEAWAGIAEASRISALDLAFLAHGIEVTVVMPLDAVASAEAAMRLAERLSSAARGLSYIVAIRLRLQVGSHGLREGGAAAEGP